MATDKVAHWLDIADYDLDTAEAMYQTGRRLYVAFMCHQVIEKGGAARLPSVSWRAPVEGLLVRHTARRPALHLQSHAVDQRKFK